MDLSGLLGLAQKTRQQEEGLSLSNLLTVPGAMAAYFAPQRADSFRRSVEGMLGIDTRTQAERLREELKGVDITKPEGQKQAVELVRQVDPVAAVSLLEMFTKANPKAQTPTASTTLGKLRADLDAGFITQDQYDRAVAQATAEEESPNNASAVSTVYKNGTVLQTLPNGEIRVTDPAGNLVEGEARVNALRQARAEELEFAGNRAAASAAGTEQIARASAMLDQVQVARSTIANYNEAISAIDDGANTGTIASKLPSFSQASKRLDAVQKSLGLDVIGNTTFGALSSDELQFALSTALPTDMEPQALREWLVKKRDAQTKLANYLENASLFLYVPGNTVADWLQQQRDMQQEQPVDGPAPNPELLNIPDEELERMIQDQRAGRL